MEMGAAVPEATRSATATPDPSFGWRQDSRDSMRSSCGRCRWDHRGELRSPQAGPSAMTPKPLSRSHGLGRRRCIGRGGMQLELQAGW